MAETKKGIPLMSLNDVADITQVNKGFNKIDELIENHENEKITNTNGVHGLRYNQEDEELEFLNESNEWESLAGLGSGTANISPVKNIKIIKGNGNLKISFQDPDDVTWGGTKLVYKLGSYPQNPKDGTLVVDNKVKNQYKDEGININALTNGSKYYFMFFPYDNKNKYSFDVANRVTGTPQSFRVMTLKIDQNNSNPETCCTYHDDAVGMTPGSEEWDDFFGHYPCLLKGTTEVGRLKRDDFTKFEDGTDADITTGNSGNVMICFPLRLIDISTHNNITTIKITDNLNHNDFNDRMQRVPFIYNNKIYKKIYYGAYKASLDNSNKFMSISGVNIKHNYTTAQAREAVKKNGETYNLATFYAFSYIQLLFLFKYKTLDSAPFLNNLNHNSSLYYEKTGGTEKKGMDYVEKNELKYQVHSKLFGIEDIIGHHNCFIEGLLGFGSNTPNKAYYIGTGNFNDTGSGYFVVDSHFIPQAAITEYFKNVLGNLYGFFMPKPPLEGSSSTYYKTRFSGAFNDRDCFFITNEGTIWSINWIRYINQNYINYRIMAHIEEVIE